jgi:hypothetical protein
MYNNLDGYISSTRNIFKIEKVVYFSTSGTKSINFTHYIILILKI